ncbi:MAG: hypothetical protein WBH07_03985, partial [Candidatus Methanoculleus thermohydrogenotrophicum]
MPDDGFSAYFDVQVLKHDRAEPIHHPAGSLMSKIEPPVSDPFMDACNNRSGVPLSVFRKFPLRLRKRFLVGAEEPRILDS